MSLSQRKPAMSTKLGVIRTYRRDRFEVELAEHVEYENPADTIAWDDPEAEGEYVRRIHAGLLPWYCLGVHVYAVHQSPGRVERRREIGAAYLGCVDTLDVRAIGVREMVREAIEEARHFLETFR